MSGGIAREVDKPVRGRQSLNGLELHGVGDDPGEQPRARHHLQVLLRRRRELLERVARGEHQAGDPVGVAPDQRLRDGTARVVGDDRDVVEVQGLEEVRGDPRHAGQGQIGIGFQRDRMGAPRQVWGDATMAVRQARYDLRATDRR